MDSGKVLPGPAQRFERPVFAAVIHPQRSLGPGSIRIVMTLCCLAAAAVSIPFLVLGVWPVAGFFGLDLLALFVAFRLNVRDARAFEEVVLTPVELMFRRVSHRGRRLEWRFNPVWTSLHKEHDDEFGLQKLALVSRGRRVVIARELSPPEREEFAAQFGKALADVKRGM
jgi:uncharacterized membrane protein